MKVELTRIWIKEGNSAHVDEWLEMTGVTNVLS